jgi:hypothetical protein
VIMAHFPADHGYYSNLGADDHTQYHTDARGDVLYPPKAGGAGASGSWLSTSRGMLLVPCDLAWLPTRPLWMVRCGAGRTSDSDLLVGHLGWCQQLRHMGGELVSFCPWSHRQVQNIFGFYHWDVATLLPTLRMGRGLLLMDFRERQGCPSPAPMTTG